MKYTKITSVDIFSNSITFSTFPKEMKIQEYVIFVTNKTGVIFLFVSSRKNVYINKK